MRKKCDIVKALLASTPLPTEICFMIVDILESYYRYKRLVEVHSQLCHIVHCKFTVCSVAYRRGARDVAHMYVSMEMIQDAIDELKLTKMRKPERRFNQIIDALYRVNGLPKLRFSLVSHCVYVYDVDENKNCYVFDNINMMEQIFLWNYFDAVLYKKKKQRRRANTTTFWK